MKITSIEPQKKRKKRLNLYVDGNFRAGIDSQIAATRGLFEGKDITEEDISDLAAKETILNILINKR
jgi:hypothetical protein